MKKRNRSNSGDESGNEEQAAASAAGPKGPFNNPFAAALKDHPAVGGPQEPAKAAPAAETKRVPAPARAVVRIERKGHGGKDVTVIEQLGLNERDLERWMKSFKAALGCGGGVEGGSIMLQGDHRERLKQLLADRGVKKISVG